MSDECGECGRDKWSFEHQTHTHIEPGFLLGSFYAILVRFRDEVQGSGAGLGITVRLARF